MELIEKEGKYYCPACGSNRIMEVSQNTLIKRTNLNTGKLINPNTGKTGMSNREKALEYDCASNDGIGCWYHECRKCGWTSEMYTE